jgi:hypothetical protein
MMNEIKIEDMRRLESEIERLRGVIEDLSDHGVAAERMEFLKAQGQEIERLKETTTLLQRECAKRGQRVADLERLIIRAADALEPEQNPVDPPDYAYLIRELRKAAE